MSAKKGDLCLFLPGADGWEIWNGTAAEGFELQVATDHLLALEVTEKVSGPVQMALPVRQLSSLPFRAQTEDLSILEDLAMMHLEKNGSRPALDGGQLSDHFVYGKLGEETLLTAVVLNPPQEGQLPRRSPGAFDLSPRCLPLPEGKVVVWRELGRWVFAIGRPGGVLYFQCLSGERLDERGGNDVRLALTQLQIQGVLEPFPDEVIVWSHGSATDARPEELESFSRGLGLPTTGALKPAPSWPAPPSRLLPADVRAERMEQKNKRNRNLMIAAAVLAYLGLVGFLYFNLKSAQEEVVLAEKKVSALGPEAERLQEHRNKWESLAPVVESDFYPYEVLFRVYKALPNTKTERLVRLTEVSLVNQFKDVEGGQEMLRTISIKGLAPENAPISEYNNNLNKSEELQDYNWIMETPSKTKTGDWSFRYTAEVKN
ncbi:hypothetical protein N9A94_05075 [Akkermansiaceae bacterium]|nr:hypothetical protein [Akkermansiaceae bacterium]MDA7888828.1 hypothetical protein [Akkermansiaceae bacterium]MDB4537127.1 hypothetical protein [Akkermansiaceae bacterium]